jgi:hypothetical protein
MGLDNHAGLLEIPNRITQETGFTNEKAPLGGAFRKAHFSAAFRASHSIVGAEAKSYLRTFALYMRFLVKILFLEARIPFLDLPFLAMSNSP